MSLDNFDIAHTLEENESTEHCNDEISSSANSVTSKLSGKIKNTRSVNIKTTDEDNQNESLLQLIINSANEGQKEEEPTNELDDHLKDEKFEEKTLINEDPLRKKIAIVSEKQKVRTSKANDYILILIDIMICTTAIGPLVIGFWRGIWGLMDLYLEMFPLWLCFTFSILLHTTFAAMKYKLHDYVNEMRKKNNLLNQILCLILKIFYTFVFGMACIMHWKNGWIIMDKYFYINKLWINVGLTTSLTCALGMLRCIRNLIAPPYNTNIDKCSRIFLFPTLCKRNTRGWSLYLLDCAFSVGVVGTLVVFVWRGVWNLFDIYLLPEDREYSALGSLAIGYVIVVVTFSLQPLMRYVCARLGGLARLITADAFLLLSFLGTVNVWRGIWNLLDLWLLPNNLVLSCWITSVGCFVFLLLLNCSNSILVRGVYIDAEEEDGKCVTFPCHYLRLFVKIEREKKEARRRNLLSASNDFASCTDGTGKEAENGALLQNSTSTTIIPGNPESLV